MRHPCESLMNDLIPDAPILNKYEIQSKLLKQKLHRMQESLRKIEMKNHEKLKPKQIKNHAINEAKRDRLGKVQTGASPSKRKSTRIKKIALIHSQLISSEVLQMAGTHRLIETEAVGDFIIADACDASLKPQTTQKSAVDDEECLEAIQMHIDNTLSDESIPKQKIVAPVLWSKESLIDMLSEEQKKVDGSRLKTKTEVISILPSTRVTRSRTRSQRAIDASTKNIITQHASKPTDSPKVQRRSKENELNGNCSSTIPWQKEKNALKHVEYNFEIPVKSDRTDIEMPIKIPLAEKAYETILSIDDSDKKRLRENTLALSKTATTSVHIGTRKVDLPGNFQISLEPSDVFELYTQDVNSVAVLIKDIKSKRASTN